MKHIPRTTLSVAVVAALGAPPAVAQLEEIIVTAQKREQSLQDVPMSIVAISGDAIIEQAYSDMQEVSVFVPNLDMYDGFVGQVISIRGIGTNAANEAFEQAVAQFHDGVYYGRDNLGQNGFFDLERVEVARGPQPIFAGQSATAGALSYISRRPGDEADGYVNVAYGSDEELTLEGAWGGPLSDTFGIRVAGKYYELGDNNVESIVGAIPQGTKENTSFRIIGDWHPNDALSIVGKYEYHDIAQFGQPSEYTRCEMRPQFSRAHPFLGSGLPALCALDAVVNGNNSNGADDRSGHGGTQDARAAVDALNAASGAQPGDPNFWGTVGGLQTSYGMNLIEEMGQPETRDQQVNIGMLEVDYDFGEGYTFTSITSYVDYDKMDWLDPDRSSFAVFTDLRFENFEQKGQEFRITSPTDQFVSWIADVYYQDHDLFTEIDIFTSLPLGPPGTQAISFGGELVEQSTWKSAYLATTWNISDTFRINAGGRYQDIEKSGTLTPTTAFLQFGNTSFGPRSPGTPVSDNADTDGFLPEVGFEFNAGDMLLYGKYAEAIKAGGFVMSPAPGGSLPDPFSYNEEKAKGFEAGLKGTFLDGTLSLNLAAYYTEYTDLQVTVFVSETATFITQNAASAHTQGIEFDGTWAATDNFTLGYAGHIGEAVYDDYLGADCNSLEAKMVVGPCSKDRAGDDLNGAKDWSLTLLPSYTWETGNYSLTLNANMVFAPSYWLIDEGDQIDQNPSYNRIDARLSIAPIDANWELAIYGRDLTDERVRYQGNTDFQSKSLDLVYDADGTSRDRGRRFGIQGLYRF